MSQFMYIMFSSLCICITLFITTMASLSLVSWNMRSFSCAVPYVQELLKEADILMLSEHRLFHQELYKLEMISTHFQWAAKSSDDLNLKDVTTKSGHCGVAMCWKKSFNHRIKPIKIESDRIIGIEINKFLQGKKLVILGVYMPHQACVISSFDTHLPILEDMVLN